MQFQVLGPLAVELDGESLPLGPPLQRRVLAALLLRRNENVARRTLIEEVWSADAEAFDGWELEDRKRGALFTYIARLRVALAPAAAAIGRDTLLVTEDGGYRLDLPDDHVDETEFRGLIRQGQDALAADQPAVAVQRLDSALALWRGRPLGSLHTEAFARDTVARLDAARLEALEATADAFQRLHRYRELLTDVGLGRWIEEYPDSERLHHALVIALHRSGQPAAALSACQDGIARLHKSGSTPTLLYAVADELSAPDTAPRLPPMMPADLLEAAAQTLTSAVRRQWQDEIALLQLSDPYPIPVRWSDGSADVAALASAFQALDRRRLVVLGPAGSGKTTLAVMLTVELATRRLPGEPVPVLLSLSSWRPGNEHLHAWLRRELAERYPILQDRARFGPTAIADLVADRRLVPILDGLDEVPASRRSAAIRAINRAVLAGDAFVLTSRAEEYRAAVTAGERLTAATIIEAQPVRLTEAAEYLRAASALQAGEHRWEPVLAALTAQPDGPLAAALTSPSTLMLTRQVYGGASDPAQLLDSVRFPDRDAIEAHLLDVLVPTLLEQDAHRDERRTVRDDRIFRDRLAFLARHARSVQTYDLAWWDLARSVRPLASRVGRSVTAAALIMVIAVVIVLVKDLPDYVAKIGLVAALQHCSLQAVKHGLAYSLGTLAAALCVGSIIPPGPQDAPRRRRVLTGALQAGAAGGGVLGLVQGAGAALGNESAAGGVVTGVAYGLGLGFAFGLSAVIAAVPTPTATDFRLRGRVRRPARMLGRGVAAGAVVGLVVGGVQEGVLAFARHAGVRYDDELVIGLLPALVFGLVVGPASALIHWSRTPIAVERAHDLRSTLAVDRRQYLTLLAMVTTTIVVAFTSGALVSLDLSIAETVGHGVSAGLGGAFVLAVAFGFTAAWPRYQAARLWLVLRGRLPWDLTGFLAEAHRIGVLRRHGAVYQFRHGRLRDSLAGSSQAARASR
ncbi:BTAD domain-containing putative transcriptional regulator [Actinoplanes sichuanensis]|uniref:BTAD domain-containing putative transcriptional regulator n=1 Tax=Actinoplanes sichuanensis TaxID=512349 RepID=A0ABW4A054_9ACTN|nr:BTAD domain-containing putative transcriptional regulator [Actinoplanes sichuanensis]